MRPVLTKTNPARVASPQPGRRPGRTSSNTQVTAHLTRGSPHDRPVHSMQLYEHFLGSRSGHLAPRPVDAACEASLLPTAAARACSRIGARRSRPHSCGYCAGPWPWSPPPDDHSIALTWPTRGAVPRRLPCFAWLVHGSLGLTACSLSRARQILLVSYQSLSGPRPGRFARRVHRCPGVLVGRSPGL